VQNRVSVGFRNGMESPSVQGSSPVTPRVWIRGVRMSPLVPLVSPQRVLRLATVPPVAWTLPFHSRLSLSLSLSRASSSPRHRRCFGELARTCLRVSGQATPSITPLASPQHRRRVGCSCRALVSPHCLLRRELTSLELRHGHRRRGQGSVVHHSSSFLSQKLS